MFGRYRAVLSRIDSIRQWFSKEIADLAKSMGREFREVDQKTKALERRMERLEDSNTLSRHAKEISQLESDVKRLTGEVELLVYRLDYPEDYKKLRAAQGSLDKLRQHKTPHILESSFDFKGAPTKEPELVMMELKSQPVTLGRGEIL